MSEQVKEKRTELLLCAIIVICATVLAWKGIVSEALWVGLTGGLGGLYTQQRTKKKIREIEINGSGGNAGDNPPNSSG